MAKIERDMLSIVAEFAVASELGRRNIYAQPTFGHLKKTDLLIMGKGGKPYKGTGVTVTDVDKHKEKWEKIASLLE